MKNIFTLLLIVLLTGCAQSGIYRENRNEIIETYFATVNSVKEVQLESKAAEGAIVGGVTGLAENLDGNSEEMIAGTIAGAIVGALFTSLYESIFDGGYSAYEYQLTTTKQEQISIVVSKENYHEIGQCVRIRKSEKVSLSAVDSSLCNNQLASPLQAM